MSSVDTVLPTDATVPIDFQNNILPTTVTIFIIGLSLLTVKEGSILLAAEEGVFDMGI